MYVWQLGLQRCGVARSHLNPKTIPHDERIGSVRRKALQAAWPGLVAHRTEAKRHPFQILKRPSILSLTPEQCTSRRGEKTYEYCERGENECFAEEARAHGMRMQTN